MEPFPFYFPGTTLLRGHPRKFSTASFFFRFSRCQCSVSPWPEMKFSREERIGVVDLEINCSPDPSLFPAAGTEDG